MTIQPRSRRFQFRLRSLLVAVAAICIVLAWSMRPVYRRAQILERAHNDQFYYLGGGMHSLSWEEKLPFIWRLLGARPQSSIAIRREGYTREEIAEIKEMFPEANVIVYTPPPRN
jgi:hypothetical protein